MNYSFGSQRSVRAACYIAIVIMTRKYAALEPRVTEMKTEGFNTYLGTLINKQNTCASPRASC
jgi:hypothetical protein